MNIADEKKALRRTIKARRSELCNNYVNHADKKITAFLLSTDEYKNASCVFSFVGCKNEICTLEILSAVLRDGKRLCVPLCTGVGIMEAREIFGLDELKKGAYGIFEPPASAPLVDITDIQLAVVPCVSCSHDGKRLGHGGGYYDRFLDNYGGKAVMLCYEELINETVPVEAHDKTILPVITDRGVFR